MGTQGPSRGQESGISGASEGLEVAFPPSGSPRGLEESGGHSQTGMSLQQSVRPVCQSLSWVW